MTARPRPKHAITLELKVGLHHCDPLAVAWHGRYFEWLEVARTELFDSFGLDVPTIRSLGLLLYVVDARCRYMAPLRLGERARVTAWVAAIEPLLRVAYEIHNLDTGRWAARATTVLAATAADGTLLASPPAELLARLPVEVRGGG
jgi:acyl-CoA thioester hydrolase